jgi:hypothetical protein
MGGKRSVSEADDAAYRRRIGEVLERHGFRWVLEQAEAQIAEGKPSSKEVSERESVSAAVPRRRRVSLITSEPYSESERLEVLLQAIEAAIIQRAKLEQAVLNQFSAVAAIDFQPEDAVSGYLGRAHHLDRSPIEPALDLLNRTEHALIAMRGRNRAGA